MKVSSYILFAIFTIVLACIASPVSAADNLPGYMVLKGGIYSPSEKYEIDNFNGGQESTLDPKSGVNGEIAFGYYIAPIVAIELGVGYFESKASATGEAGETKLKVIPALATGKVLMPLGPVEPYGEFGIGAYFSNIDVNDNSSTFEASSNVTYGLHAGGGLNFNLTDTFFLGVEGRYLWAKPSFDGEDIKINGFTATVNLGSRF